MDEQSKEKILWLRKLLKENAPKVYQHYASYKLHKKHEQLEIERQENISK
jgi:hypothetical protein